MTRLTSHALFPLTALAFAGLAAFAFIALGGAATPSLALAFGVFASAMSMRNWWQGEEERPLLAEELIGLHEAVAAIERDGAELRRALARLAETVETHVAGGSVSGPVSGSGARPRLSEVHAVIDARLAEFELAQSRRARAEQTAGPRLEGATRQAIETFEARLAAHEERGRRLSSALALALSETKRLRERLDADDGAAEALAEPALDPASESFEMRLEPIMTLSEGGAYHFEATPAAAPGAPALSDAAAFLRCASAAGHLEASGLAATLFCDLSMATLRSDVFLRSLEGSLAKRLSVARRLVIEIEQQAFAELGEQDAELLRRLRALGVGVSIDRVRDWSLDLDKLGEVGAGYVKLDAKTFLARAIEQGGSAQKPIAALSQRGVEVIVENVSDAETLAAVEAAGVVYAQGGVFGAPTTVIVPAPDPLGAALTFDPRAPAGRRAPLSAVG